MTVPDCWQDVHDAVASGIDRLLLFGPSGTGKTYFALHEGVSEPAERVVCTEDMTGAEFFGMWVPSATGRWSYVEGPGVRAWRGTEGLGRRLVVDEVDHASGDAYSTLLAVTDSLGSARWCHPETLEWVVPGPQFSVVATSNVESPAELPPALRDRFPVAIAIDQPHPNALTRLSEDLRGPAATAANAPLSRRYSTRAFMAFDQLRQQLGQDRAAELVFGRSSARDVLDALRIGSLS